MSANGSTSWNVTRALSLLSVTLIIGLYDLITHGGKNVDEHSPQWLKDLEMPIFHYAVPVIILVLGFVVAHSLRGSRRAHLGIGVFGIFMIVMNLEPTITRWQAYGVQHTFMCWVIAAGGLLTAYYAYKAYQESGQDSASASDSRATVHA
ncbi:MAG: hypothetical protein GEU94_11160 [Micromonosporaceae bacterium]|nr:hypothetical protein [Micromonosporaceae bacterium]